MGIAQLARHHGIDQVDVPGGQRGKRVLRVVSDIFPQQLLPLRRLRGPAIVPTVVVRQFQDAETRLWVSVRQSDSGSVEHIIKGL